MCILVNARSIKNKFFSLHFEVVLQYNFPEVILVTETWLTSSDPDSLFLCHPRYAIYRKDREVGPRGGVAVLIRNDFRSVFYKSLDNSTAEGIVVKMLCSTSNLFIALFYRRSVLDVTGGHDIIRFLQAPCFDSLPMVVCGDFNLPDINWKSTTAIARNNQHIFLFKFQELGLVQKVLYPTRSSNILDLVFENTRNLVANVDVIPFSSSDHALVMFELNSQPCSQPKPGPVFAYSKMDIGLMRMFLETQNWPDVLGTGSVSSMCIRFSDFYNIFIEAFVPRVNPCSKNRKKPPLPKWVRKLNHKYRALKRKLSRSPTNADLQARVSQAKQAYWHAVNNLVRRDEQSVLQHGNEKAFWSFVNQRMGAKKVSPLICLDDGTPVLDPSERASMFNDFYSSVQVSDNGTLPQFDVSCINTIDSSSYSECSFVFTHANVSRALSFLNANASPGPDGISPRVLKVFHSSFAIPLCLIFQKSWNTGSLPPEWKIAHITPIYKNKGSTSKIENYRPISLTSYVGKTMESIVKEWMLNMLTNSNSISRLQHGFLPSRSTTTNLLSCVVDFMSCLDMGDNVDIIYLDIAKAFDTVSHKKLLVKLRIYGFPPRFLNWISEFLRNRTMLVKIDGELSTCKEMISGVPQGSVLGPLLFMLYVNDLPNVVRTSEVRMYADDTKLYHRYPKGSPPIGLENDLKAVLEWFETWQLKVSLKKCHVLQPSFSSRLSYWQYAINGENLDPVDSVRDLGVTFSKNLKPHAHINHICRSSLNKLKLLFRCFHSRNIGFLLKLYKTFVRPLLEYCTPVWNPSGPTDINMLERVQRSFTKRLPGLRQKSYKERLFILDLEPLELRRLTFDLVEVHRMFLGLSPLLFESLFTYNVSSRCRNCHDFQILPPRLRTASAQSCFHYRIVRCWNALPVEVIRASSIPSFKNRLKLVDLTPFLVCYNQYCGD